MSPEESGKEASAIRALLKLLGLGLFWGPALVLVFWGGTYAWGCVQVLAGPVGPIDLEFQTPGGPLRVRAENYVWDRAGDQLVVRGLEVSGPDGRLLASAQRLAVLRLRSLASDARAVVVRGKGVRGTLELGASGLPTVLDLVPESDEEPSDLPFSVELEDVVVECVGTGTPTGWYAVATIPMLHVDGVGDRWIATAEPDFGPMGRAAMTVRSDPGQGLSVGGTVGDLELAGFLAYYRDTEVGRSLADLDDADVGSLRVGGALRASLPPEGPFEFSGRLAARAQGLALGEISLAEATFEGDVTHRGASGVAEATTTGVEGRFEGSATWSDGFEAAGRVRATAASSRGLPGWVRRALPEQARFDKGAFEGWVSFGPDGPRATGLASAALAEWDGEILEGAAADVDADARHVSARLREGVYLGSRVSGGIDADLVRRTLRGGGRIDAVSVERLARHFGVEGWAGLVSAEAAFDGSLDRPAADLRVRGELRKPQKDRTLDLGSLVASARLEDGVLRVRQASLAGPVGSLALEGEYSLSEDRLRFEVFAGGLALDAFLPELQGTGAVALTIAGKSSSPRATGRAELYGASMRGQVVPLIVGDFTADADGVLVSRLDAAKGAARLSGSLGYRFADRGLFGEFTANRFQLAEWLGEEVTGLVDVDRATVRGTVDNPQFEAAASLRDLLAFGVRAESGTLRAAGNLDAVRFDAAIRSGDGEIAAGGSFNVATSEAALQGSFSNVELGRLLVTQFDALDAEGALDGSFEGHVTPDGLADLSMDGTVRDVTVNGVPFGGGSYALKSELGIWSGNAMVGGLERFLEVPSFIVSQPDRSIYTELVAYQLQVEDLVDVVKRYVPALDPQLADRLDTVTGRLDASVVGRGRMDDPTLEAELIQATDLALGGQPMGRVDARVRRSEGLWNLDTLQWSEGPGRFAMSGTYAEGGELRADGEIYNLDLGIVSLWRPSLSGVEGTLKNLSFLAEGTLEAPQVQASLHGFVGAPHDPQGEGANALRYELSSIVLADGELNADGWLQFGGLRPRVTARVPFDSTFAVSETRPLLFGLALAERDMTRAELEEFPVPLDLDRSSVRVAGEVRLEGIPGSLALHGGAQVTAPSLALEERATSLQNLVAELVLDDRALGLKSLSVDSSDGGTVRARFETARADIQQTLASLLESYGTDPEGTLERAWATPVAGEVVVEGVRTRYSGGVKGSVDATTSGRLELGGTVRKPNVTGLLEVSQVSAELPSEPLEAGPGGVPTVDPTFRIDVRLVDPANLRAGNSTMVILGEGTLAGSLGAPDLGANLVVQSGVVRLPTARVVLEQGGTMRLRYAGAPGTEAVARLDIDLEGRTNVTALRFGDQVERYNVTLNMRGDLLEDGGVRMTATSDPPDLSNERILRLLGQADLFEGLASVLKPGAGTGQFQGALATIAIPVVFDPITERLASQLGLDYLTLEYNALDQTTIAAAKSIGYGLILQGRRQVGEPQAGFPPRFELRLSYRLPSRNKYLGRTTLVLGRDQDRPWKLAIEYGTRF